MKRPFVILCSALALVGCKNSPPASDPFLRTTIPPPGTGTAAPYYPGGAGAYPPAVQPGVVAPPIYPGASPGMTPPPNNRYAPPGGSFNLPQSSTEPGKSNSESAEPRAVAKAMTPEGEVAAGSTEKRLVSRLGPPLNSVTVNDEDEGAAMMAATNSNVPLRDRRAPPAPFKANRSPVPEEETGVRDDPAPESRVALSENSSSNNTYQPSGPTMVRILGASPDNEDAVGRVTLAVNEQGVAPAAENSVPQETGLAVRGSRVASAAPPTEITDLPKAEFRARRRNGDVLQVSHSAPIEGTVVSSPLGNGASTPSPALRTPIRPAIVESGETAALAQGRYSHTPSYDRLHGRLEYSQSARQWKIRYIPIDGQTDDYGGSVVLADSPALEGFKPGDFVAVQGAIGQKSTSRGFSPTFNVRLIEPLRQ